MHYTQCILLFILKPIAPKKWIDAIQKISNKHSLKPAWSYMRKSNHWLCHPWWLVHSNVLCVCLVFSEPFTAGLAGVFQTIAELEFKACSSWYIVLGSSMSSWMGCCSWSNFGGLVAPGKVHYCSNSSLWKMSLTVVRLKALETALWTFPNWQMPISLFFTFSLSTQQQSDDYSGFLPNIL